MIILEAILLAILLPLSVILNFLGPFLLNPYVLYGGTILLFIWTALVCRYECKMGEIKMKDTEIPVEEVDFKISNFVF
jgi:hypothetical protein